MSGSHTPQVPVAVVGLGALVPGSTSAGGFWRTVLAGRDLITDVPASRWLVDDHYDPDPAAADRTYARRGAFLSDVDFDPLAFGLPPTTLQATDVSQLLALMVADQVLDDAGGLAGVDRERVGVILGAAATQLLTHMYGRTQRPVWLKALRENGIPEDEAQAVCDSIAGHYLPWQESTFPGLLGNVIAGRVANRFDLHGTNHTTDAACASSFAALSAAVGELALGRSDLVISGGVDTANDIGMFLCFSKTPALSPSGDCRPFSEAADGTMLGEAVVMYALKRLSDAERAGDRIYAVIRGIGSSSDGKGTAIYAPLPEGQARALRRTYEQAGYAPGTVELVEAHGTGTRAGDAAEFAALHAVFDESGRRDRQWCALGSVKSQIGHTKCAAGAAGLLKAVLALHHKVLPPTVKVDRPNPAMDVGNSPFYLNTRARPWVRAPDHPRRASVSSFGFGGSNFHVTLEEYVAPQEAARAAPRSRSVPDELVLLSASSPESLLERAFDRDRPLAEIARESQRAFSPEAPARLALVVADTDALCTEFARASASIRRRPHTAFSTPDGVHYAAGVPAVGRIGFLFPGQGAQYTGMGADVAMLSPAAQAVWDRLGSTRFDGRALHDVVLPPRAFTDEERAAQLATLTATEWAQPALAVHSLALLAVLRGLGLRPDCVAGHSFGELAALHAAGALDAASLVRLARRRGELMRDAARTPGAMLAVNGSRDQVAAILAESRVTDVWPANHNAPRQVVVSGTATGIEAAELAFAARGLTARRLNASTAFHTPVVASATAPLSRFLRDVAVAAPGLDVYGNADASPYPSDPDQVRRRLAEQVAAPVLFEEDVETMYAAGVRTFVEVGPGATLTGLVGRILGDREHAAVPLDRPGQHGATALHTALGRLAVRGVPLDHDDLWAPYGSPGSAAKERKPSMTVKINGAPVGQPYPPAGGPAGLPVPNPPRPESAREATAPRTEPAASPGTAPDAPQPWADAGWLAMVESVQRQAAEAHAACHRALVDSHVAFLRMTETTLASILGTPREDASVPAESPAPLGLPSAPATLPTPSASVHAPAPAVVPHPTVPAPAPPAQLTPSATVPPAPVAEPAPVAVSPVAPPLAPAAPPAATAVAAVSPVPAVPDAGAGATDTGSFADLLLSVVAEHTGYPADMLNVDMELESDLGIDSIKRVEILAAMRRRVGDPPAGDVAELGKLHTLREIVEAFTLTSASPPDTVTAPAAVPRARQEPAEQVVLSRLAVRTVESPAPGLAMAGLGDGPLAVLGGDAAAAGLVAEQLTRRGIGAQAVRDLPDDAHGVVYLGGLAGPGSPEDAVCAQREAFRVARELAPRMTERGGVFVTVQDTGGDFGLSGRGLDAAWLGGLAALARTVAREWPRASVKAIDCERGGRDAGAVAEAIVGELLGGGPALEAGLRADGTRVIPCVVPAPRETSGAAGAGTHPVVGPESLIVASGGARGVTAAALIDLARSHRPRIVLLGRTEPAPEPPGLTSAADEAALTRALGERRTSGVAPAALAAQAREILAAREIRSTVAALEAAGSPVRYVPVDIRDGAAVAAALREVREAWGPVTGIVHGAGVLADTRIADKTDEQFDRVVSTKVDGLRALLVATADDPLDVVCLFSSVSGVFGNAGQSDYAMANGVLGQVASALRLRRPGCLVRSIAWGPWRGGMVTPELAGHFGRSGVALIPVAQGAAAFTAELDAPGGDTRIVLAAAGEGGSPVPADEPRPAQIRVSWDTHPYLAHHAVADAPVLPVAMALNWFVGAAAAWRPGADGVILRDLRVFGKIALPRLSDGGHVLGLRGHRSTVGAPSGLEAELRGEDDTPGFRTMIDFEAPGPGPVPWEAPEGTTVQDRTGPEALYDGRTLFHGPLFRAVRALGPVSARGAEGSVAGVEELGWPGGPWHIDPAAVDGGLQLALLWAQHVLDDASLPMAVAECRVHRHGTVPGTLRCVVRARKVHDTGARCDVVLLDADGSPRVELLGVELVRRPA